VRPFERRPALEEVDARRDQQPVVDGVEALDLAPLAVYQGAPVERRRGGAPAEAPGVAELFGEGRAGRRRRRRRRS
jgi:hypothetical protein